jgi:hypothetical protein
VMAYPHEVGDSDYMMTISIRLSFYCSRRFFKFCWYDYEFELDEKILLKTCQHCKDGYSRNYLCHIQSCGN